MNQCLESGVPFLFHSPFCSEAVACGHSSLLACRLCVTGVNILTSTEVRWLIRDGDWGGGGGGRKSEGSTARSGPDDRGGR